MKANEKGEAQATARPAQEDGKQWMSLPKAIGLAEQLRKAGRLTEAENICRQILQARPAHAEVLHMLAIIRNQAGSSMEAIELLQRAIAANGSVGLFHSNLTELCRQAGRFDEALTAGLRAVELRPDYPEGHNNLGIVRYDRGEIDQAIACYKKAIGLRTSFAEAHSNLGNALRAREKLDEALAAYACAIELAPNYAEAYNNRGTALREAGRLEEAESSYRRALALKPNDPETLNNLALALNDLDRHTEALDLLQRSGNIAPGNHKTLTYLASTLLELDRPQEARTAAEKAVALAPEFPEAIQVMGRVQFEQGDAETAIGLYRRVIELKPDMADAYNNMGNALKEIGKLDEAQTAYEQAIEVKPDMLGAFINLVDSKKFQPGDRHLAMLEGYLDQVASLTVEEQFRLHFSLGKAYGDLKSYDTAFEHLLQANALKRSVTDYDEPAALALFDRIRTCFTPELIRGYGGHGDPSAMPIFVLGMPRSGTTLVEQILASHPQVKGAGELRDLSEVVGKVRGTDGNPAPYPEFLPALEPRHLAELGAGYVRRLTARAEGAPRVTDKMPSNYYFVGLIHLILPNARIVHVRRNPADTCLSCFQRLFSGDQPHTYDLGELGRYYRKYAELMEHWHEVLPAGAMLELDYEILVGDIEAQTRRLVEYCGLPWDDACLSFHRTNRPVKTASATQVRQPVYRSSVGRWRVYEAHFEPLLDALGDDLAARC